MTNPIANDALQFIEQIKQPAKLLEGCKRFHDEEPRDIAYVVCSKLVSNAKADMSHILAGLRLFLQVWNAVYIQHLARSKKQAMEGNLADAYQACIPELTMLSTERLSNIDLSDTGKTEAISKVFSEFAKFESIGDTGASKAIHLLNPSLFMMWDTNIRVAYATLWPDLWKKVLQKWPDDWRKRLETQPPFARIQFVQSTTGYKTELYLQFIKLCQTIAQALLNIKTESKFWSEHISFAKDKDFFTSWVFSETLTKMIDECNFVRWRLEIQF